MAMTTVDRKQLGRQILEKGVRGLLEEAKVPLQVHLKVVKALADTMKAHKEDRKTFLSHMEEAKRGLSGFSEERQRYIEALRGMAKTEERLKSLPHIKGEKGDPGTHGVSVEGRPGRDGRHGVTPSMEEIVKSVLPYIEKPESPKEVDINSLVTEVIREIQKGDKLHIRDIRGASGFIKDGIKYRYEELMHGGGGGAGSTFYVPTGTVNAVNTVFGTSNRPKSVVADGITYFEGAGYSYSAPNVTMSIAPSQFIRYTI